MFETAVQQEDTSMVWKFVSASLAFIVLVVIAYLLIA
jgi:hypothetical protein